MVDYLNIIGDGILYGLTMSIIQLVFFIISTILSAIYGKAASAMTSVTSIDNMTQKEYDNYVNNALLSTFFALLGAVCFGAGFLSGRQTGRNTVMSMLPTLLPIESSKTRC